MLEKYNIFRPKAIFSFFMFTDQSKNAQDSCSESDSIDAISAARQTSANTTIYTGDGDVGGWTMATAKGALHKLLRKYGIEVIKKFVT